MADMKKYTTNILAKIKQREFWLLSIIIVLSIICYFFILPFEFLQITKDTQKKEAEIFGGIESIQPLAQGEQVYTILTDKPKNPQIIEVSLDPLDVEIGGTQTIFVKIKDTDNNPITDENKVSATITTDNKISTIPFVLRRADGPDLITIWEGKWVADDTHDFIYQAAINAISSAGKNLVELTFR